jgi:hypothetical protein
MGEVNRDMHGVRFAPVMSVVLKRQTAVPGNLENTSLPKAFSTLESRLE